MCIFYGGSKMLKKQIKLRLILAFAAYAILSSSVYADSKVERLGGNDRYETSISIADYYKAAQLDSVIVTSGEGFADAISGSMLQSLENSPVMLVNRSVKDSKKTLNYIENNLRKDGTIYVLGGEASVNTEFEDYFKEKGFSKVVRLGGKDRYETNIKIASLVNVKEGTPIVIVSGENFPDALSISSIAAYNGYPIFITPSNSIPKAVEEKINETKPSKVYIIGGTGAVSSSIENKLKEISKNIVRIQGKDRYETSMNICKYFGGSSDSVVIANGQAFPDALFGSAVAAKLKAPIVITDESNVNGVKNYVDSQKFKKVIILGGEGSISKNIEKSLNDTSGVNVSGDLKAKAVSFVNYLAAKDIDKALEELSSALRVGNGESIMKNYFSNLSFNWVDMDPISTKKEEMPLGSMVTLSYKVEGAPTTIDIKIKYDNEGQVYDFTSEVTPGESKYKLPSYANVGNFAEKDVLIGDGKYKLPGLLTMPKGNGPFPAVILVHGSGANDRDETYGDTKIFKDISAGLASKGIAVLRYDKRTRVYGCLSSVDVKMDLNKETVDDAVSAVSLLKQTEGIDSNKVFVLGHSQGAMLTSTIIKDCSDNGAAGGIMMAGPVDFLDTFLEQSKYLNSIGSISGEQLKSVENLYTLVKNSKDFPSNVSENTPVWGGYPYYWLSVKNSTQVTDAVNIKAPLFILQGKMDCQVDVSNLDKWKNILRNKQNVDYNSYDRLNHFFIETKAKDEKDYGKAANVPEYVVNDIANWINKQLK